MRMVPKARITGENYMDLQLWDAARYFLDLGVHQKKGSFYPLLSASLFSFFAFEAYLNEVGRRLHPCVWERERDYFAKGKYQGTLGKFKYLAESTGYSYRPDTRPFQTVRALATVRSAITHGRAEVFDVKVNASQAESRVPLPKLEQWARVSFAEKAIADVEMLADGLMAAAKAKFGEWSAGYRSSGFTGITDFHSIHPDE